MAGVDLFFVLSGFLVSGLIFREFQRHGSFPAGRFLVRRGLKIYPAFYVFLACSVLGAGLFFQEGSDLLPNSVAEFFFIQNYPQGHRGHTWSLAVEEHFYVLLAAVAIVVLPRIRDIHRALVAVAVRSCGQCVLLFPAIGVAGEEIGRVGDLPWWRWVWLVATSIGVFATLVAAPLATALGVDRRKSQIGELDDARPEPATV